MGNLGTQDQPVVSGNSPVEVTNTSQQMSVNTKYIANNASRVNFILPVNANLGDQVLIRGKGAGGWKVSQNVNQTIHGASDTTSGVSGYLQSQTLRDTVALECTTPSTDWLIISNRGTLDIV